MIEVYENVLSEDNCEALIEILERDIADKAVIKHVHQSTGVDIFESTELKWDNIFAEQLKKLTTDIGEHYLNKYDPFGMMPEEKKIEAFRIKKYTNNEGCFPLHVDSRIIKHATRYLAFLFYLNDSNGGTRFRMWNQEITVPAVRGNVCVFPPNFLFPHEGLMPTDGDKYIMSVYYHINT